jgi:hypothetical protein
MYKMRGKNKWFIIIINGISLSGFLCKNKIHAYVTYVRRKGLKNKKESTKIGLDIISLFKSFKAKSKLWGNIMFDSCSFLTKRLLFKMDEQKISSKN